MHLRNDSKYAVIDLGTNTCLLLIANLHGNNLTRLYEAQEIPRLGKDLYHTGNICTESFQKSLEVIKKYIFAAGNHNVERIFAFGTSALREANNNIKFIDFINKETGICINILSGEQEAKYSYEGAIFDLEKPGEYAVIDVGGGSTEIINESNDELNVKSLAIGSVRLHENFFSGSFSKENIYRAKAYINQTIKDLSFDFNQNTLVGVAGAVTTLSAIKNGLNDFDENIIHKSELRLEDLERIFHTLICMTERERLEIGSFMRGRSDIIISGALIILQIMEKFEKEIILVSTKGLRYGLMLNTDDFF